MADQQIQDVQDFIERARSIFGVEATETFIDEYGVEPYLATSGFDNVSQTKRERQGSNEGFTAGKRGRRSRLSGIKIKDLYPKAAASAATTFKVALHSVAVACHRAKAAAVRLVRDVNDEEVFEQAFDEELYDAVIYEEIYPLMAEADDPPGKGGCTMEINDNDSAKMLGYWVAQANISKMQARLLLERNADRRKRLEELLVVEQHKLLPL